MNRMIALLTDFGIQDGSVGVMKGVILGISPSCVIVDVSHHIPPQDIGAASFIISTVVEYFPPDTIFLVVVDPGVGSNRRGLAGKMGSKWIVCPDNGIITDWTWNEKNFTLVTLSQPQYWRHSVCPTFHGRDIFAPVAAHLSLGISLEQLGSPVDDPVLLPFGKPDWKGNILEGVIRYIDHFGNLVTNFEKSLLGKITPDTPINLKFGNYLLTGISSFYSSMEPGKLIAVVGGFGYLEIACVNGNAAQMTGLRVGDEVKLIV